MSGQSDFGLLQFYLFLGWKNVFGKYKISHLRNHKYRNWACLRWNVCCDNGCKKNNFLLRLKQIPIRHKAYEKLYYSDCGFLSVNSLNIIRVLKTDFFAQLLSF